MKNLSANRFFLLLIAILALFCFWLLVKVIDMSITIDHQTQEVSLLNKKMRFLVVLANFGRKEITKKSLEGYLNATLDKHSFFFKNDNIIVADEVSLHFSGNELIKIEAGTEE